MKSIINKPLRHSALAREHFTQNRRDAKDSLKGLRYE